MMPVSCIFATLVVQRRTAYALIYATDVVITLCMEYNVCYLLVKCLTFLVRQTQKI